MRLRRSICSRLHAKFFNLRATILWMHAISAIASVRQCFQMVPRATCETELPAPLLSQLKRDMQYWVPRSIRPNLLDAARLQPDGPTRAAVMIVNRTLYWQRPTGKLRSPMLLALLLDLQELVDTHQVSDVELVLNVGDHPTVYPTSRAASQSQLNAADRPVDLSQLPPHPVFSHYQTSGSLDVLCPSGSFRLANFDKLMLRGPEHYATRFPWDRKISQAFWRGNPYCGRHRFGRCSRLLLPHLSAQNASTRLDVGLTFYESSNDYHLMAERCASHISVSVVLTTGMLVGSSVGVTVGAAFGMAVWIGIGGAAVGAAIGMAVRDNCRAWCRNTFAAPGDLPVPATPLLVRQRVGIERHAAYKYLLQLDGFVGPRATQPEYYYQDPSLLQ